MSTSLLLQDAPNTIGDADHKDRSVAVHTGNLRPTTRERLTIGRISRRQSKLVLLRRRLVKTFRNNDAIAIPSSVLTGVYSLFMFVYIIVTHEFMNFFFLLPSLFFVWMFAFPLSPKFWSKRLIKNFKRLEESNLRAPGFIKEMSRQLEDVHEPELLVLRKLPVSDTVQMMRLVRVLESIRPDVHQNVTLEISGETSETLSRVREALLSNPNQLVVRV